MDNRKKQNQNQDRKIGDRKIGLGLKRKRSSIRPRKTFWSVFLNPRGEDHVSNPNFWTRETQYLQRMPITLGKPVRRLSQREFGEIAYAVMGHVFQIHDEFGNLFAEPVYKKELAHRVPGLALEVPIQITHDSFGTTHYFDVLVGDGAPFEFKAVDALVPRHSAQLLHYLLLAGLAHGKLVNVGKNEVEHEFVNTSLHHEDRVRFEIIDSSWNDSVEGSEQFRSVLTSVLRDWGTGLDLELYEKALAHFLGNTNTQCASSEVEVRTMTHSLGTQKVRLAAPHVTYILTALPRAQAAYESSLRRFRRHTDLTAILWANIGLKCVTFATVV
jgi:GxxExxY protein